MYKRDELPVRERPWVRELLGRESFTGKEAGELAGKYGADAITQLRNARGLRLVRVGKLEGGHHRAGRFRLVEEVAPYDYSTPFTQYIAAQRSWSERTFGPGTREKGVIDHIRKELEEIQNALPGEKLAEWVDVIILAIDGAWRCGATPDQIAEALGAKQVRNFNRSWPDWRTMSEDQAIEHDRSADASPSQT